MDSFKHLMVGVDFSPRSTTASHTAIALARTGNAKVTLVHVVRSHVDDTDSVILRKSRTEIIGILVKEASDALDHFARQFMYPRLHTLVLTGHPATELHQAAIDQQADILVAGDIGSQADDPPRGVGFTAYQLVEHGPQNVLIVKAGHNGSIRSVAAAISFVPVADAVLNHAYRIARLAGARLHAVRVIPDYSELRHRLAYLPQDLDRKLGDSVAYNTQRLKTFLAEYDISDTETRVVVLQGHPGSTLVKYLQDQNIDLVVLGTGTSYRLLGHPVGSTTHRILNQTLSSVYIVRSGEPSVAGTV